MSKVTVKKIKNIKIELPFLRHVTSNKTYDFCLFYKFINVLSIDFKIGIHIDCVTGRIIALAALQGRVHSPLCTRMLLLSRALAGARAVS